MAMLSYDNFNHFTEWNAGSTNQEWYVCDAAGNRVLRRFTNNNGTSFYLTDTLGSILASFSNAAGERQSKATRCLGPIAPGGTTPLPA